MRPAIVRVEWVDAITRIESCPIGDVAAHWATALRHRETVGYLVHQDKRRVVLASDYDEPEQDEQHATVSTFTILPAGWVTQVHVVLASEQAPEAVSSPQDA